MHLFFTKAKVSSEKKGWKDRNVLYRFFGFFGHLAFDFQEVKIRTSFLLAVSQLWIMCIVTYIVLFMLHNPESVDFEGVWKVILALIPAIFQLAMHIWGILKGKHVDTSPPPLTRDFAHTEAVQNALEVGKEYLQGATQESKDKGKPLEMSGV